MIGLIIAAGSVTGWLMVARLLYGKMLAAKWPRIAWQAPVCDCGYSMIHQGRACHPTGVGWGGPVKAATIAMSAAIVFPLVLAGLAVAYRRHPVDQVRIEQLERELL